MDVEIIACDNTTICQILNNSQNTPDGDTNRPYILIDADRRDGDEWVIEIRPRNSPNSNRTRFNIADRPFSLEVISDNRRARVILTQDGNTMIDRTFRFEREEAYFCLLYTSPSPRDA